MTKLTVKKLLLFLIFSIGIFFRFYLIQSNPISLFSDEVDMGYQAYSLVKTGCDYSGYCLPVQFHSFSDVQPPIPIYLIALLNLLGVSLENSIRLVSAIAGAISIPITYLLVNKLLSKKFFDLNLPGADLFAALILSFTPWHFTYSRIGFSLALLYLFVTSGLLLFLMFLERGKVVHLYLSICLLSLTPAVYNTAKLAILFYPFILATLPGAIGIFKNSPLFKVLLIMMFLPLVIMFLDGNTSARFDYISIFSDPTAAPEVNFQRSLDSGPFASLGTSPSTASRLFHNKIFWVANNFIHNFLSLLSTDFLYIKGDPNLRHSPANSGMLLKTTLPLIILGFFQLASQKKTKFIGLIGLLAFSSLITSAITRDGGSHASRSFVLILPIVVLSSLGLASALKKSRLLALTITMILIVESTSFVHDYWYHYRYASERAWSGGMKELIATANQYLDHPVVISHKGENPLIFFAFYTRFDPGKFQSLIRQHQLYNQVSEKNIDGHQVGDTNLFIGKLIDYKNLPNNLPNANFFLTKEEFDNTKIKSEAKVGEIIYLPSGLPLYYQIHF